jgi:cyclophilin family peptidyl-prolyl cis-trans isomerase
MHHRKSVGGKRSLSLMEQLERRRLLAVDFGLAARFETNLGQIDIELFDDIGEAPQTVANFLNYVQRGDYTNTIFHRSVPGFVVQGGGYLASGDEIAKDPPILNEYWTPNVRGTIAMAKVANDPHSATNQWFFNVDDNSTILDTNNNEGFSVFGQIVGRGRRVTDDIAARAVIDKSDVHENFTNAPMIDGNNDGVSETHVIISSITQMELLTATLGVGHESSITFVDADGTTTVLTYTGQGTAVLKFVGTGINTTTDGTTITVNAASVQLDEVTLTGLTNGASLASTATGGDGQFTIGALNFTIGTGSARSMTYVDSDGTASTISLNVAGTADMRLSGGNLNLVMARNIITVSGINVSADEITLAGTNLRSSLVITSRGGDGATRIGGIFGSGDLGVINGRTTDIVAGAVSLQGTAGNVILRVLNEARLTFRGNPASGIGSVFNFTAAIDSALHTQVGIRQLRSAQWTNTDDGAESMSAAWIGTLNVPGNFDASLIVQGLGPFSSITNARIGGSVNADMWQIQGSIRVLNVTGNFTPSLRISGTNSPIAVLNLRIGGIVSDSTPAESENDPHWSIDAPAGTVFVGQFAPNTLLWFQEINNLRVTAMTAELFATYLGTATFTIMSNAMLRIDGAYAQKVQNLRRLNVTGTITDSQINVDGNVGVVTAQSMIRSRLFVGGVSAGDDVLPSVAGHFSNPASLQSLILRGGGGPAWVDSNVAAYTIGTLNLGLTMLENNDLPHGVAAATITSLALIGLETAQVVRLTRLDQPADLANVLAARGIDLRDFEIRML